MLTPRAPKVFAPRGPAPARQMTSQPKSGEVQLEWTYSGIPCTGRFVPAASVLVLQFMLKTAVIMATYRIIDQNSTCPGAVAAGGDVAMAGLKGRPPRGRLEDGLAPGSDGRLHRGGGR